MEFTKAKRGSRNAGAPTISLRKSNSIGVNSAALEEFFADATDVEVFYDPEEQILAFKPLNEKTDDSYTISRTNGTGSITPTSFLKQLDLVPSQTTHYEPYELEVEDGENYVAIDVSEPVGYYGEPEEDE